MDEIRALAMSAGYEPVQSLSVRRARQDPALSMGSGKADELKVLIEEQSIGYVIFDNPLSPVQQRNLNRLWGVAVLDRTELILDIFAQRARSNEGTLQVELARIEHQLTRLVRGWTHLERQRGGFGQRGGPGEKQIELDRRMLDTKARLLRARLEKLEKQRKTRRRSRERRDVFTVSLVGYTNAGKSTLFNALTGAGTYVADQLFATLDTLTRKLRLPDGTELALSDTVGFVRDLPHQLVQAFRATLDETAHADLLLHVVDASAPDRDDQIEQVNRVLTEIGAADVPMILVYNKIDVAGFAPEFQRDPCGSIERLMLSARTGAGLDTLHRALSERIASARGPAAHEESAELCEHDPASADTPVVPPVALDSTQAGA